jgi:hypothetical protein
MSALSQFTHRQVNASHMAEQSATRPAVNECAMLEASRFYGHLEFQHTPALARQRFSRRFAHLHKCGVLKRVLQSHRMINRRCLRKSISGSERESR